MPAAPSWPSLRIPTAPDGTSSQPRRASSRPSTGSPTSTGRNRMYGGSWRRSASMISTRTLTTTGRSRPTTRGDSMAGPINPELYDQATADAMREGDVLVTGLPAYLGIKVTDVGPGTMTATLDVRDDLLNPFGSLHGGVISALVDHVLGAVLYPVIERCRWAATTEFKLNLLSAVREGSLTAKSTV